MLLGCSLFQVTNMKVDGARLGCLLFVDHSSMGLKSPWFNILFSPIWFLIQLASRVINLRFSQKNMRFGPFTKTGIHLNGAIILNPEKIVPYRQYRSWSFAMSMRT